MTTEKYYKLRQDLQKKLEPLYAEAERLDVKYYESHDPVTKSIRAHLYEVIANLEEAVNNLEYFVFK